MNMLELRKHNLKLTDLQCLKSNFVNETLKQGLNISTSSSRSPISSSADECLRLKASSSARNPGKTAASACSLSHCLWQYHIVIMNNSVQKPIKNQLQNCMGVNLLCHFDQFLCKRIPNRFQWSLQEKWSTSQNLKISRKKL